MKEWVALIPTRSNTLRVRFEGGGDTGYGFTPATFTTHSEPVMNIIERSILFREGKIRLLDMKDV